jgi:uncharacterized integral membrane protein
LAAQSSLRRTNTDERSMNAFKEVLSLPVIVLIALLTVYGWVMTEDYNSQHIVAANGE